MSAELAGSRVIGRIGPKSLVALLVGALALVGAGWSAPASAEGAGPPPTSKIIIMAAPGALREAAIRVEALGGHVTRALPLVGGFAAAVPTSALALLRGSPAVRSVTADTPVRLNKGGGSPPEPNSVYTKALDAERVWQAGYSGQGVTVAVVDTGISSVPDVAGRLLSVRNDITGQTTPCMDLSGENSCTDTYGHGTFVGGIIAGNGAASNGLYSGVAPQANLLPVKVAGANGASDVSNVLAAIQWVVSFKSRYNIRVLNLSLSTDSTATYRSDPFNYAVERAWDAGIVVVVSASNRGPAAGTISKPGDDPLVITVGAVDDRGTPGVGDDELPDFTSRGPTPSDGLAKPDVVAPGAHLVSLRSIGSYVDRNSTAMDGTYHRGSGTSFSAAAVSGVVALMLSRNPGMTPNQVKYALTHSARTLPGISDPMAVGAGEVDAYTATLNPPAGSANGGVVRSTGTGLLADSRGHVWVDTLGGVAVTGELTAQLILWDPLGYTVGWNPTSWYLSTWALTPFLAVTWSAEDWPGRNWGGRNWGGGDWEGSTWGGTTQRRQYGQPVDGSVWYGAWG